MINYIRISFNDIEDRIFIIVFYIIDFIEFNKKLFSILSEFRIKMYTLIVSFIMIFFKTLKVFHVRIMFININNDSRIRNICFYNKYIISIFFF